MLSEPPVALNKSPKGPTTEEDQHTVVNQGPVDADKELKDRIYQWLRENQDPGSETARTLKRASSADDLMTDVHGRFKFMDPRIKRVSFHSKVVANVNSILQTLKQHP
eukprot:CAMPEP_0113696272 /NCGR_PEP_ID=MMETSP0038_2-20120614/21385_1 /TAXON_ID=2898 /ORGANISM="Cryptomonas paramecium" /LENGTH=107 /DNA_ID=CAMNT_0000618951 /DNA_START=48 /DNA_END=372 /DNA_ORIENTATION=- /assembly_acc=CAM_ASM_000170